MKRLLLLLNMWAACCFAADAQTVTAPKTTTKSFTPGPGLVIKDSLGKVLDYETWRPLLTSGNYILRSETKNGGEPAFYQLLKMTAQQKQQFADRRARLNPAVNVPDQPTAGLPSDSPVPSQLAAGPYAPTRLPQQSQYFKNGEAFDSFSEKDINGSKINIKKMAGKIIVLNFWFINCPACRYEIPELNKVVAAHAGNPDVVFVGLCLDQHWQIADFLKTTPFNFQQIADAGYYGKKYNVNLYPTTVVLDKKGIIRFNSVGADNTGYWITKTIADITAEK